MPKRIIWKQEVIKQDKLADWLTVHNMQPHKFKVTYLYEGLVLVIYIDKIVPNEE